MTNLQLRQDWEVWTILVEHAHSIQLYQYIGKHSFHMNSTKTSRIIINQLVDLLTKYVSLRRESFSWSVLNVDISVNRRRKTFADIRVCVCGLIFQCRIVGYVVGCSFGVSLWRSNVCVEIKNWRVMMKKNNKPKRSTKKFDFFLSRKNVDWQKSDRKMHFNKQRTLQHIRRRRRKILRDFHRRFILDGIFFIVEEQSTITSQSSNTLHRMRVCLLLLFLLRLWSISFHTMWLEEEEEEEILFFFIQFFESIDQTLNNKSNKTIDF